MTYGDCQIVCSSLPVLSCRVRGWAFCYTANRANQVAPHGDQNVHVHLVSAISNGLIVEFYRDSVDPMWRKMYRETLLLNDDGTLTPPSGPGLGVELNEEALAPYRVE